MDTMQEKGDRMIGMLTKRHLERKLDIEKTLENRKLTDAENEKIDYFENAFAEKRQQIESSIINSPNVNREDLAAHFDDISKDILTLQKYVANSNMFLRGYDIKIYLRSLQDLTNHAKDLEELLIPKKKFGFRNKNKAPKVNGVNKINGVKEKDVTDGARSKVHLFENLCGFSNENNKKLTLDPVTMLKKDVALANLQNCTVTLFGSPSTLHMSNLSNCYIFCGPVSTSIFAEYCHNCTFVIACQQLRLHSSKNVDIYLHVTSRAIMEDCNEIYMAPYNLRYVNIEKDFATSGLDMGSNNWTGVDDFNWLNAEKRSPNWCVLEENKRTSNWDELLSK